MIKSGTKMLSIILIALILTAVFPFSALAAEDSVSDTITKDDISAITAGEDLILRFYEQHKEYAASLGIAMIDNGNTELYYLGDIANDPDYVFDWGSCTKVLTWVSVMQLAEQGKIDLNTDIKTYLPEGFLTRLKYNDPITMLNLMNHDAGFQEMSGALFAEDKSKIPPLDEALKDNQPPQIRRPGETVAYSNFGAALAGYIVECVSQQDYGDYVISYIFAPLGMEHTAIKPDHSDNEWVENKWRTEKCYTISRDGKKFELGSGAFAENPLVYGIYGPAGSACGTIEDFSKFVGALIPDEDTKCPLFEKDSTLTEMYNPTLYYAECTPQNAHGMWTEQFGNGLFGHGGNSAGFSSNFLIDPIAKKAHVVMTNVVGEVTFCYKLLPLIFGDYDWGDKEFTACEDISGRYNSMRSYVPHGFLKIESFLYSMLIEKSEQDNVYYLNDEKNIALTQISDRAYMIDDDGMIQFFFVADNGVLQTAGDDLHRKNVAGYYAEWALFGLCIASFLFAVAVLFTKFIILIVRKIRKQEFEKTPKEKHHLFSLVCGAAVVLLLIVAVNLNISYATIAVFGVIATISAVAAFVLGIIQVKTNDARLRTKILRVLTLAASTAVLTNVFFWEFFNCWSV